MKHSIKLVQVRFKAFQQNTFTVRKLLVHERKPKCFDVHEIKDKNVLQTQQTHDVVSTSIRRRTMYRDVLSTLKRHCVSTWSDFPNYQVTTVCHISVVKFETDEKGLFKCARPQSCLKVINLVEIDGYILGISEFVNEDKLSFFLATIFPSFYHCLYRLKFIIFRLGIIYSVLTQNFLGN